MSVLVQRYSRVFGEVSWGRCTRRSCKRRVVSRLGTHTGRPKADRLVCREVRSGCRLAAAVGIEDGVPNRLLRAGVPIRGTQQREAPTFSVDGVLSSGERDVTPSRTSFPD